LTYCRYPPIPSLATDTTNRRHLDYCTPLLAAYALHPSSRPALPGAVARALGPWPPARSSQVPTTPAQCFTLALPAFAHALPSNHGADARLAWPTRATAEKGSVTFRLRVLDLCFPRGAQHRSWSSCIHCLLVLRASCIMPPPRKGEVE
jgi:hypothetical protein